MRAMILAAGRGERLRPLTDTVPKPLIDVGGKPLIEHHLERLAAAGFREVVINCSYLGAMLQEKIGNGDRWRLSIHWSDEQPHVLETGGGIFQALPLLGPAPFLVINSDIWTDYPLSRLRSIKCDLAHLILVPNPQHNLRGDFALGAARVRNTGEPLYTFSGISVYHPRLFASCVAGKFSVVPLLRSVIKEHCITGELFQGTWGDIGTLQRLEGVRRICAGAH